MGGKLVFDSCILNGHGYEYEYRYSTLRKGLKLLVVFILAFAGSIELARYFDGRVVNLPNLFTASKSSQSPNDNASDNTSASVYEDSAYGEMIYEQIASLYGCKDLALGEVEQKPLGGVYTWLDEQGVAHFSDAKPQHNAYQEHDFAGKHVFDYFDLKLIGNNLPVDFKNKLNGKINKLFTFYGQLLDKNSLKKTAVNLRFFSEREEYERYRYQNAPALPANSAGFYSDATNQAAILFIEANNSANQAMNTATHETSHAINRSIIGYSNRWLNEGLAEYLETIDTEFQSGRINPNLAWYTTNQFRLELLPLVQLFNTADADWNGPLNLRLYATSWAFIYYLMDSQQGKDKLAKLVRLEQQDLCDRLSAAQIQQVLTGDMDKLQRDFTTWTRRGKLQAHRL